MKYTAHTLPYATGRKAPSLKHVFVLNGLTRCPETCAQRLLPCRVSYRPQGVYWLLAHCFPHEVCGTVHKVTDTWHTFCCDLALPTASSPLMVSLTGTVHMFFSPLSGHTGIVQIP